MNSQWGHTHIFKFIDFFFGWQKSSNLFTQYAGLSRFLRRFFSRFKLWPKWFSDYDRSNTDQLSCHSEPNTNRAKPINSHPLSRFYRLWNAALADTSLLVVAKSPISFSIMTYAINARSNVLKIESNQLEKSLEWKKTKPGGVQLPIVCRWLKSANRDITTAENTSLKSGLNFEKISQWVHEHKIEISNFQQRFSNKLTHYNAKIPDRNVNCASLSVILSFDQWAATLYIHG